MQLWHWKTALLKRLMLIGNLTPTLDFYALMLKISAFTSLT